MNLDELLASIQQGILPSDIYQHTGSDWATAITDYFDIGDPSLVKPGYFPGFTKGEFEQTLESYYKPFTSAGVKGLSKTYAESLLKMRGSGLAGGYGTKHRLAEHKDVYGRGVADIFTGVKESTGQAKESIMSGVYDMLEQGRKLRYG